MQKAASWLLIENVEAWDRNPRINATAIPKVAASIRRFGFVAPVVVWPMPDGSNRIVAGHTRIAALRSLLDRDPGYTPPHAPGAGLVPVRQHPFANEAEANAYAIADNRLSEIAQWDDGQLAALLLELDIDESVNVGMIGFSDEDFAALMEGVDGAMPETNVGMPLDRLGMGDDTRSSTVVIAYDTEHEAASIRRALGLPPKHNFKAKKMFSASDLWSD